VRRRRPGFRAVRPHPNPPRKQGRSERPSLACGEGGPVAKRWEGGAGDGAFARHRRLHDRLRRKVSRLDFAVRSAAGAGARQRSVADEGHRPLCRPPRFRWSRPTRHRTGGAACDVRPEWLADWPDCDHRSRLVFVVHDIAAAEIIERFAFASPLYLDRRRLACMRADARGPPLAFPE